MFQEKIDGINYFWLKTPSYHGSGLYRIINMIAFIISLYLKSGYFIKRLCPDAVIASSTYPLDIFPAKYIANRTNGFCVFEVHDLWPLSPMQIGGLSKFNPFIIMMQIAEDYACRKADKIISILPFADRHLIMRGMNPNKYVHVPNGIEIDDKEKKNGGRGIPEEHIDLINNLKHKSTFLVGYTGAHGLANALDCLVEAGIYLQKENIAIILVGQGPEKNRLERMSRNNNLGNVYFLPPVAKECMNSLLCQFDVLFIGLKNNKLFEFGISPNKLIDYMYSGKPVINAINAGNNPVKESGCGITVEAENSKSIADGIKIIKELPEIQRREMGARGHSYILKNHTYEVLGKKICEALVINNEAERDK